MVANGGDREWTPSVEEQRRDQEPLSRIASERSARGLPYSPEFRLVATCAMWPPSDRRNEAIHAAASGPLDCSRLVRVAACQRVIELVHDAATYADSFLLAGARPVVTPAGEIFA